MPATLEDCQRDYRVSPYPAWIQSRENRVRLPPEGSPTGGSREPHTVFKSPWMASPWGAPERYHGPSAHSQLPARLHLGKRFPPAPHRKTWIHNSQTQEQFVILVETKKRSRRHCPLVIFSPCANQTTIRYILHLRSIWVWLAKINF